MFCWSKPDRNTVADFIRVQHDQSFSYPHFGNSRHQAAPSGYTVDHNRTRLGEGIETFARAKHAIAQWEMFRMPWVELCWPDASIEVGTTVAIVVAHWGFWSMNACRIDYMIEEHGEIERYGFAYGTLCDHAEIGEERFSVEFNRDDSSVWYDLYAFSRPGALTRFVYPFSRRLQKRFACESLAAMRHAVTLQAENSRPD